MQRNTQWFAKSGWGVFCHYLSQCFHSPGSEMSAQTWNDMVDAFDVRGLAQQLHSVGAPYFFITIGQGSGYFCAPNATYDRLAGIQPSKCSRRDLIADLHAELDPLGIKLLVYSAAGIGWNDHEARPGLKLHHHHNDLDADGHKLGYAIWRQHRQVDFMRNIEAIHAEWSARWGSKIHGWWIDGCYEHEARFPDGDPPNFETFAAALRTGSPEAIVCFNTGVKTPIICSTVHEDYTPGEISRALPECRGPWVEKGDHRARYHTLSYLGEGWCKGSPRFPIEMVVGYTKHVTAKGGVVTWDVPIGVDGLIPEPFLNQLGAIGRAVARAEATVGAG